VDLYEHQGKDLFDRAGIPLPERAIATTPDEAAEAAEEIVPEEDREQVAQVPEVEVRGTEAAGLQPLVAVAVVELARVGLREHLVRLGRLPELLLGIRVVGDVRVQLAREPPERGLDRAVVSVAWNAENLVVVAPCRCHALRVLPACGGTAGPQLS